MAAALASCVASGVVESVYGGGSGAVAFIALMVPTVVLFLISNRFLDRRFEALAVPGQATILSIIDCTDAMSRDKNVSVELELRVEIPGCEPNISKIRVTPRGGWPDTLPVGAIVPVRAVPDGSLAPRIVWDRLPIRNAR